MMTSCTDALRAAFLSPPAEYGPMPFWFWNDEMTPARIEEQLRDFLAKGVTGFVLHPRIGMPRSMPYLSESFMAMVRHAVRFAAAHDMRVLLYDEAMYPSGSAHGLVVKANPVFASVGLRARLLPLPQGPGTCRRALALAPEEQLVSVLAVRLSDAAEPPASDASDSAARDGVPMVGREGDTAGTQAGETAQGLCIIPEDTLPVQVEEGIAMVVLPGEGRWRMLLFVATPSGGTIRGLHFGEDDGEPDAPPSADLLNPDAVRTFLTLTHERYAQWLQRHFGRAVIGFFTDEPCILGRNAAPGLLPWTWDFLRDWQAAGLPETALALLVCEAADGAHETVRRRYRQAVARRLDASYYQPLAQWCVAHGLALAGHPEGSMDVGALTHFGIPGQDLVWRWVGPEQEKSVAGPHSTMAKSAADTARYLGRRRNANECFGCCGPDGIQWAFSADDMKWMLDWLFLRGTNLIIPHAFFASVDGPGRYGERPPDVGPHNIWWPEFGLFSQYIRRMSWLRTDSREVARVAVICRGDWVPWRCALPLYRRGVGFHYLQDAWLSAGASITPDGRLKVGEACYDTVMVEAREVLPEEARTLLTQFAATGGQVCDHEAQWEGYAAAAAGRGDEPCLKSNHRSLRLVTLEKLGCRFHLLGNEGDAAETAVLQLPCGPDTGGLEIWHPWTGAVRTVPLQRRGMAGTVEVSVRIERREVLVLCVCGESVAPPAVPPAVASAAMPVVTTITTTVAQPVRTLAGGEVDVAENLSMGWTLSGGPLTGPLTLETLVPWAALPGLDGYCGSLFYERAVDVGSDPDACRWLDFGDVGELLRVWVNGRQADSLLWSPYRLDVTGWLRGGINHLRLEVVNSLAHRYEPEAVREKPGTMPGLRSGLMGPVMMYRTRRNT